MNFTAALRISNCRRSLASLPKLHCSLVPKGTRKRVPPSQKFISKSIRPRLSKKGNVAVVVIVVVVVVAILRYLGLCREASLFHS